MKYFKTYEAYRLGVNGVGSLRNSLAALKRQNINGRYVDPEILAQAIRNEYEAITGEKYEDEVQMSMDNTIADIIGHYKLDGPDFMAAWDKVVKESVVTEAFIGPFVFNDRMSDDELKAMYNGALDGYANYSKGFQHSKSDYKRAYQEIEKILKKRGVSVDESVNEASDQQRLTHLRKFGIAPNNQPQNGAYIKQVAKPGKFFVDWKDAFDLGDVALEFVKSVGSISEFDIIDLKTMKRTGKQLDVKKGQLGNLRTTYGVRVNESVELDEATNSYKKGQRVDYQLTHKGGVGKFADATSKSKNIESGVIKKRTKGLGGTFKYELTNGLELYGSEIVGLTEAEFKHINKDEHAIKLAIKDVEKKARLKANRNKPLEYEQLSLNKIMLSKVLGREKLGKEHQAAWEKLKKEYSLKESIVNEAKDSVHIKKLTDTFDKFKLNRKYEIMMDSLFGGGSKIAVLRKRNTYGGGAMIDTHKKDGGSNYDGYIEILSSRSGRPIPGKSKFDNIDDAMQAATKFVDSIKESVTDASNNLEKIFGTDQETMDIFQGIEDKGTVKDMAEFIDEFGNEEELSRFGIKSTAQVKKLAKTIMNESYKGNFTDFKYDLEMAIDNMDISPKSIKSIKKTSKGYEVRLSSYMSDKSTWEKIGDTIGAKLISFKPGSINIGIYE